MLVEENKNEENAGIVTEEINTSLFKSFSEKKRNICFTLVVLLGIIFQFLAVLFVFMDKSSAFAVMFTLGWLIFLAAPIFLVHPLLQIKQTAEMNRLWPAAAFLLFIVLVYIMGLAVAHGAPTLIFLLLEWASYFWYVISFISGARDVV